MDVELSWGRFRRQILKLLRPGYVRKMAEVRQGSLDGATSEVLDSRDLKYIRNQCDAHWRPEDDRFAWRDKLPFARWGLCELQIFGYTLALATALLAWYFWYLAPVTAVMLGLVVWFFRDPRRRLPPEAGLVTSPADGAIAEIVELEHDEFVGGPAVKIGIFLSIFNVHINRVPLRVRVIRLVYNPGEFLNALRPESAIRNENMWIGLEEEDPPHRRIVVRQISGAIARRIVCDLRPGEVLDRGAKFGMIKLGSRTELIVPREGFQVLVAPGTKVRAGESVLGRYGVS